MPQSILASLHTLLNTSKYPFELQFSLHKCPKPSWQAFWPPHNQANAHLNLDNSSLNKCPKPTWQGSRPSPPDGQCPNRSGILLGGASLRRSSLIVNIGNYYDNGDSIRVYIHWITATTNLAINRAYWFVSKGNLDGGVGQIAVEPYQERGHGQQSILYLVIT